MNGMLRELAAWMASNPEQFGLVVGAVVAMVLQGLKRLWGWQSGDQTFAKRIAGVVLALGMAWAAAYSAGAALTAGQVLSVALTAWFSAQGVHALALRKAR